MKNNTNKEALKNANIDVSTLYNTLKGKYYDKLISETNMSIIACRKFYQVIKSKKIARTELPNTMSNTSNHVLSSTVPALFFLQPTAVSSNAHTISIE